jgi:hypothetical protein
MNEHPLNEQVSVGNARITAEPKSLLESMFNAVAVILVREMSF